MGNTRRAHYLSRFYLDGFTPADGSGLLHVRSKRLRRAWRARPEETGHQRDLFRTKGEELEADEIENAFAAVEAEIAPALYRCIESEAVRDPADMGSIIHVVALNASRPPAEMEKLKDNIDVGLRKAMASALTPELHERFLADFRAQGGDTTGYENIEQLRRGILGGAMRAVFERDYFLVRGVLGRATELVDLFAKRSWTLVTVPPDSEFICSDRPVNLLNNRNLSRRIPPRYDDPRFDVIMPLSRRLALVGRFGGSDRRVAASRRTVGFINYITEVGAHDYLFMPTADYLVSPEPQFSRANATSYEQDFGRPR